ncbi:MAG: hypothetical protein QXD03_02570 [Candidatus Anstonellales archaeon]
MIGVLVRGFNVGVISSLEDMENILDKRLYEMVNMSFNDGIEVGRSVNGIVQEVKSGIIESDLEGYVIGCDEAGDIVGEEGSLNGYEVGDEVETFDGIEEGLEGYFEDEEGLDDGLSVSDGIEEGLYSKWNEVIDNSVSERVEYDVNNEECIKTSNEVSDVQFIGNINGLKDNGCNKITACDSENTIQDVINIKENTKESNNIDFNYYINMDIKMLYDEVKQYMLSLNVKERLVDRKELEDRFGKQAIKRLILASYLIVIGKDKLSF